MAAQEAISSTSGINNTTAESAFDEEDEEFESEETDLDEVILSVYWRNGNLGAAMYSVQDPQVYVLNDAIDDFIFGFKVLRSLIMQVQPTQVITCKSMQPKFIRFLNEVLIGSRDSGEIGICPNSKLNVLPGAEFRGDNAWRKVLSLRLPGEPENQNEEEHKKLIHSLVDRSQESMVHAFARLLKFLDQNLAQLTLTHQTNSIISIKNLCMDNLVWINQESYSALQIFTNLAHPSLFKWTGGVYREGLSLYGLFNRCRSKLGSKYLRAMLSRPTRDLAELQKRHEVIWFCMQTCYGDIVARLQSCIAQVNSISGLLPKLIAGQASIPQWKTLQKTNHNVLLIREICSQFSDQVPFFREVDSIVSEGLYRVEQVITQIIDFESSEEKKKFTVKPGIDEDLDKMKQTYANLPEIMHQYIDLELKDLPTYIEECSIIYIPEIGFLLTVPMWNEDLTADDISIPNMEFKFVANRQIHYKSPRCLELDDAIGDISLLIGEMELKIMLRLVQYIEQHIAPLLNALSFVAELDCFIALAEVAREYGYVKPNLGLGREMKIKKGRHPLQECCVGNFVPNDIIVSEGHGPVKILTGPNASGKSVYLKQVAVISYLAHTGSFVPAQSATMPLLDQIHTRIQSTESAAAQLSAFMIDLRQMTTAICLSTRSSLIVIDEFGKGTSEVDGLSLLTACMRHFIRLGESNCPFLFVSTHFHRLVSLLPQSPLVDTLLLEHIVSGGELVYLYQLKNGVESSSKALEVAKAKGMSSDIIKRAGEILETTKSGSQIFDPIRNHKKMELTAGQLDFMQWFRSASFYSSEDVAEFKRRIRVCA